MNAARRHLIIMAKAPRIGRVKSRLACDIGAVAAWGFYKRTLAKVARRLGADGRWQTWLGISPNETRYDPRIWPVNHPRIEQGEGDLGQRMARLMSAVPAGAAVLIGADIPAVEAAHIEAAFRALGQNDAVFGPASDGGFWLVGLKRPNAYVDIYKGVRWSSVDTLADTLANLPASWRHAFVATLDDVDDAEDLRALGSRVKTG